MYIGHCVTRALCCLVFGLEEFDFYSPNLFFIHQTYFWLVKYFSHILCTINGTSFVCGKLNHAAETAVENGTLGNAKNSFFTFWFVFSHHFLWIQFCKNCLNGNILFCFGGVHSTCCWLFFLLASLFCGRFLLLAIFFWDEYVSWHFFLLVLEIFEALFFLFPYLFDFRIQLEV